MSKKTYKITSQEGAERYGADLGSDVELDLTSETETALVAAGWVEKPKKPKEAK